MLAHLRKELRRLANKKRAQISGRFFKTGKGEYGEGDIFLGITVPILRTVAKKYIALSLSDITKLLRSKYHEERLVALLILVQRFEKGTRIQQKQIFNFYLKHTRHINNWDLVDLSADKIIGPYLLNRHRKILYSLVQSKDLWERRIAIIATFYFIKQNDFKDTLAISKLLLHDTHDLIHKAVGWMLREVGNRSLKTEEQFLKRHYKQMPRTMLRYAIEKFPEPKRKQYLLGSV